jgi:hypothetical protein
MDKVTFIDLYYLRSMVVACSFWSIAQGPLSTQEKRAKDHNYKLLYFGLITAFTLMPDSWL